jgi:hypothetical protein
MPRIAYETKNFRAATLAVIEQANEILRAYTAQGYDLTLRQLYYQFVARDLIPNSDREYNKLGSIVNDARLAGMIDWNHITDRTRFVRTPPSWKSPEAIIRGAAGGYSIDVHEDQDVHIEVWVEKDALAGVIERACEEYRLAWLSCRGYMSQSEMWGAARRFGRYMDGGRDVMILHLGDHDPSGIDMTRDIRERCFNFLASDGHSPWDGAFEVRRIALTMDQVEQYDPPPNPAKITDSRSTEYIETYGESSWELDALEPSVLDALIQEHAGGLIDHVKFQEALEREEKERENLTACSQRWAEVVRFLEGS